MSTATAPSRLARAITRRHDENFPVAFLLLPRDLRADMQAIYAFCRGVDDLGDERIGGATPAARLASLDAFETDLHRCWDGEPHDPRLAALAVTIHRHRMDPEQFVRLVEANRMDQRQSRWDTFGELIRYCHHSATPVGRMVLEVLGQRSASRIGLSDHTCIGLQLVNFWQDIRRDLADRDRIYLPREDMDRFDVSEDDLRQPRGERPRAGAGGVRSRPGARRAARRRAPVAARAVAGAPRHPHVQRRRARAVRRHRETGVRHARRAPGAGAARPRPDRPRRARGDARQGTAVTVETAYERCRTITRAAARNFYYGFVLLPNPRRAAIYAAYAFSRRADDAVDDEGPLDAKLAAIAALRRDLDAVYAATPPPDDGVLVALADTVDRFAIPRAHLDALLDGVEMDLTTRRYGSFDELKPYCDRVAGAVGLVSLHIFGSTDPEAPRRAADLGVALQIVNIMRDVAEDAGRDRIYLPQDEMAEHGVTDDDVLAGRSSDGMRSLLHAQAARADEYFASGEQLLPMLDRRARACVSMLGGLYRAILTEIRARDFDVFGERVALSTPRKLALMGQTTFDTLTDR